MKNFIAKRLVNCERLGGDALNCGQIGHKQYIRTCICMHNKQYAHTQLLAFARGFYTIELRRIVY